MVLNNFQFRIRFAAPRRGASLNDFNSLRGKTTPVRMELWRLNDLIKHIAVKCLRSVIFTKKAPENLIS